jgi:Cu2+-exporting ATPase
MQLVPPTLAKSSPTIAPSVTSASETITLDVEGMKCAGCVKVVEQQLTQHPGVLTACVNLVTEVAVVECAPGTVEPPALADRLTAAGFPTQPRYLQDEAGWTAGEIPALQNPELRQRREMQSSRGS